MPRWIIMSMLVAACAVTRQQADRRVEHASARTASSRRDAQARYLRAHDLKPLEVETRLGPEPWGPAPEPGAPGSVAVPIPPDAGFTAGEGLVQLEPATTGGPARLGVSTPGPYCSCGCSQALAWVPATTAGGDVVILRLAATEHVETIKLSGDCGIGCGQPTPPMPGTIYVLPITDPARVRIVDVAYDRYTVNVTCDHPIPMP